MIKEISLMINEKVKYYCRLFLWKFVENYMSKIANVKHPIKEIHKYKTKNENIEVIQIPALWDNYSYVLRDGDVAVIIDPSSSKVIDIINNYKLTVKYILLTHDHIDHIYSINKIHKEFNVPVLAAKGSEIPFKYDFINDNNVLMLKNTCLSAMFLPGHYAKTYSDSSINRNVAWYCENAGIIFTGDVLFSCGYGYIKKGSENILLRSLEKIRSLPNETILFLGHEYTFYNIDFVKNIDPDNEHLKKRISDIDGLIKNEHPTVPITLDMEKMINPFLRWDDIYFKNRLGIKEKKNIEYFKYLMEMKCEYKKQNH